MKNITEYSQVNYNRKKELIRDGDVISIKGGNDGYFCNITNVDTQVIECNGDVVLGDFEIVKINKVNPREPIRGTDLIALKHIKNNKFCSYDNDNVIRCNRKNVGEYESFVINNFFNTKDLIKHGDIIKLITPLSGSYCADEGDSIRCNRKTLHSVLTKLRHGFMSGMLAQWSVFKIYKYYH